MAGRKPCHTIHPPASKNTAPNPNTTISETPNERNADCGGC